MTAPPSGAELSEEGMSAEVELSESDGILVVAMNRPEKRNAMTSTMLRRLVEVFRGLEQRPDLRVVVVRGAGKSFCAGLDLAEMAQAKAKSGTVGLTDIGDVFRALEDAPQPTIAMVQGEAVAGGCELALHCDLCVAAEDVKFAMPLARLGLAIPLPLVQKLVDRLGTATAREILFTGDWIRSDRALALRVVNRLVPLRELEAAAMGLAAAIARNAPLSVRYFKRAVQRANSYQSAIPHDDLDREVARVAASADVVEGVNAMRERRAPRFQGK